MFIILQFTIEFTIKYLEGFPKFYNLWMPGICKII